MATNSNYSLTVEAAIKAGKKQLVYVPLMIIGVSNIYFMTFFFKGFFGGQVADFHERWLYCVITIVTGLIVAMAWRAFHSAQWKIMAYAEVKDIHRLQQVAEATSLLPKRGSWLDRLEYRTAAQQAELEVLEKRFDQPREFDTAVGPEAMTGETILTYNYWIMYAPVIFMLVLALVNMLAKGPFPPIVIFGLAGVIGFFTTIFHVLPLWGHPYALKFTREGVSKNGKDFLPWSVVDDILLESRQRGKSTAHFLVFKSKTGDLEVEIDAINRRNEAIEQLASEYWNKWRMENEPDEQ